MNISTWKICYPGAHERACDFASQYKTLSYAIQNCTPHNQTPKTDGWVDGWVGRQVAAIWYLRQWWILPVPVPSVGCYIVPTKLNKWQNQLHSTRVSVWIVVRHRSPPLECRVGSYIERELEYSRGVIAMSNSPQLIKTGEELIWIELMYHSVGTKSNRSKVYQTFHFRLHFHHNIYMGSE